MKPMPEGNGKTSPFGNGNGNVGGPNAMPMNPLTNPGGSAKPGMPTQQRGADPTNPNDAAPGGLILKADAIPNPSKDLGVGTIGNPNRPYRLDGGGQ